MEVKMATFPILILLWASGFSLVLGLNQDNRSNVDELEYQKCKRDQQVFGNVHQKVARAVFEDQHVRSVLCIFYRPLV